MVLALSATGALAAAGVVRAGEAPAAKAQASEAQASEAQGSAALDGLGTKIVGDCVSPSVAIGVMKWGKMIYAKAFGWANLETGTPAAADTIYKIGSNTKQFTAASILLLQEAGALSVDDPLSRHLPDFPHAADVTLRQMLTHTSGLGNFTNTHPPDKIVQMSRLDYDQKALLAAMAATDPLFVAPPGTAWSYSNTAYVLLGIVVEKVSGVPLGSFLKTRLFDPQGLTDTAKDDVSEVLPRRASGYVAHIGSKTLFDNCSFESMSIPAGAGAMRSTVRDLCAWHAALFGGKVLSPASLTVMTTPGRLKDGGQPFSLGQGGAPKVAMDYGFGLGVGAFEGRKAFSHAGGISGFASHLRTFPAEGVSVAVLLNTIGPAGPGRAPSGPAGAEISDAAARFGLVA
jgi:CubicO group peptidase (beta-lactamase class C family)